MALKQTRALGNLPHFCLANDNIKIQKSRYPFYEVETRRDGSIAGSGVRAFSKEHLMGKQVVAAILLMLNALVSAGKSLPAGSGALLANDASSINQGWAGAERQFADPAARGYMQQWAMSSVWNDGGLMRRAVWPHDKAVEECVTAIFPSPASARLVFTVSQVGIVEQAMTDQTGYIDECVKAKIVGLRIPAPPTGPFLICAAYESRGADRSSISGCGPKYFYKECEKNGSSTNCTVRQR